MATRKSNSAVAKGKGNRAVAKKAGAKTAAAKRVEQAEREASHRFLLSEHPNTYVCSSCGEERPSTSFPTVRSGEPELRKDECRRCRAARTGYVPMGRVAEAAPSSRAAKKTSKRAASTLDAAALNKLTIKQLREMLVADGRAVPSGWRKQTLIDELLANAELAASTKHGA